MNTVLSRLAHRITGHLAPWRCGIDPSDEHTVEHEAARAFVQAHINALAAERGYLKEIVIMPRRNRRQYEGDTRVGTVRDANGKRVPRSLYVVPTPVSREADRVTVDTEGPQRHPSPWNQRRSA